MVDRDLGRRGGIEGEEEFASFSRD